MESTATTPAATYRELLRDPNVSSLWLGQLVSTLGDRLHQVALITLVATLSGQDLRQVALVSVAIGAPTALFGLFAGALVDTFDRKAVMINADLVRCLLVATIPFLARVDLLWVYVVTVLLTTASLFFRPARGAALPSVVPPHNLLKTNSLMSTTDNVMDVLGYPLAGLLVGGLARWFSTDTGADIALYLDALTYLLSAVLIGRVAIPRAAERAARTGVRFLGGMVLGGLGFVRSHRVLLTNTVLFTLGPLVASSANTLSWGYAQLTRTGSTGYSILEGAIGFGSVVGALIVGRYASKHPQGPVILLGLLLIGGGVAGVALFRNLWWGAAMLAVAGAGNMLALIPSLTLVQQRTPSEMLGRVLSLRSLLISLAVIGSNALAGIGAERLGVQRMFALFGGSLIAIALLAFLLPSARDVEGQGEREGEGAAVGGAERSAAR